MANVGMSQCGNMLTGMLPPACGAVFLTVSCELAEGAPPGASCSLPAPLAGYQSDPNAANGGGAQMFFDDQNQLWYSDPNAGYPALAFFCDDPGDGSGPRPVVKVVDQDGDPSQANLTQAGPTPDGQNFYSAWGQNCVLIWRVRCRAVGA